MDSYFVLLLLVIVDNSQGKYADHVRCKILEKKKKDKKNGLSFHQTQNNSVQIIDSWLRNDIKKKDKKEKKTRCTILRMLTNDQKLNLELIRLGAVIPSFSCRLCNQSEIIMSLVKYVCFIINVMYVCYM